MKAWDDAFAEGEGRDEVAAWALALRFQREWNRRVNLDHYLADLPHGSAARRMAAVDLSQIDLELRWNQGQKARAAEYLGRLCREQADDRTAVIDLIESEYQHRRVHFQRERQRILDEREALRKEALGSRSRRFARSIRRIPTN